MGPIPAGRGRSESWRRTGNEARVQARVEHVGEIGGELIATAGGDAQLTIVYGSRPRGRAVRVKKYLLPVQRDETRSAKDGVSIPRMNGISRCGPRPEASSDKKKRMTRRRIQAHASNREPSNLRDEVTTEDPNSADDGNLHCTFPAAGGRDHFPSG